MTPVERLRVEKAASDCGFERTPVPQGDGGLELRSTRFPEAVVVRANGRGYQVSAETPELLDEIGDPWAAAADLTQLYVILQRASAIARTMPPRVADQFQREKQRLLQSTEAERWVVERIGQDLFRGALLDYWQGRCCLTGLAIPSLLRASHIKPWAKCSSDEERLDVFNGLLLAPHIDALFDSGWISFSNDGGLVVSEQLPAAACALLAVSPSWRIPNLKHAHLQYLEFHRAHEFRHVQ